MRMWCVVPLIAVAACFHRPPGADSRLAQVGTYRFRAEMWRDPSVNGARNNVDSLGVFEGVLNLGDDLEQSTIELAHPDEGPGCANHGVQRREDWFHNAGEMLMFSCPGLGPENRALVTLFFNLADPTGNSYWGVTFRQEDCEPQRNSNLLNPRCLGLGGRLTLTPSS